MKKKSLCFKLNILKSIQKKDFFSTNTKYQKKNVGVYVSQNFPFLVKKTLILTDFFVFKTNCVKLHFQI